MPRLEKDRRRKATLSRRAVVAAAPAGLLAACEPKMPATVSTTPRLDIDGLRRDVDRIAQGVRPGVLGVGLMNLESGQSFLRLDDRPFPMAGVALLPLAAAVLAEIDAARVALPERVTVLEEQLSPGPSGVAAAWPTRRDYTVEELLDAALVGGDTTAADVLMKHIGGPGVVTAWLTGRKVPGMRVDSYMRDQLTATYGMASSRPAWRDPQAYAAARGAVPPERRIAAVRAHMANGRDSASPRGMLEFLQMLDRGELLSAVSTRRLLTLLGRTAGGSVRPALPREAFVAARSGAWPPEQGLSPAWNDVAIFTLPDKRAYALVVFLSGAMLDDTGCARVIGEVTRAATKALGS